MADYKKYLDPEVLAKISRLELRARMVVEGFISGMHKSPYHGFSVEFAAHREYVPGDDIRHIDWRLYGRGDRLYIKQYEEETNLRTHVLLDCSKSMAYPEHESEHRLAAQCDDKFDYACTLAASLIYLLMHQQDACGLVLFDHEVREQIAPTSSTGQLRSMIDLIERNPPDHTTDVKMLFSQLAEQLRQRGLVVLISDLLTDVDELIAGLQRLRLHAARRDRAARAGPRRAGVPVRGQHHVRGARSADIAAADRPAVAAGELPGDRAAVHQPGALGLRGPPHRLSPVEHAGSAWGGTVSVSGARMHSIR